MSRPIKFRAWVTEVAGDSYMLFKVTPYYVLDGDWNTADRIYGFRESDKESMKVKTDMAKFELMQFTGIKTKSAKDRKSQEIYEGDILEGVYGHHSVVVYEGGGFRAHTIMDGEITEMETTNEELQGLYPDNKAPFVVIGNVHENPELLK